MVTRRIYFLLGIQPLNRFYDTVTYRVGSMPDVRFFKVTLGVTLAVPDELTTEA